MYAHILVERVRANLAPPDERGRCAENLSADCGVHSSEVRGLRHRVSGIAI
jgi:hypothetical protein